MRHGFGAVNDAWDIKSRPGLTAGREHAAQCHHKPASSILLPHGRSLHHEKRHNSRARLDSSGKKQRRADPARTPHNPARTHRAGKQQHDRRQPSIPLHIVMQRKQPRVAHQVAVRARQHIDGQLVIPQQSRDGDLHTGLEGEGREEGGDADVFDNGGGC